MKTYKIALLPGDGIGEEVCMEAVKVLRCIEEKYEVEFKITGGLIGGAAWPEYGNHFPEETKILVNNSDAILFGSVGGPVDAQFEPQWKDCEKNSILAIRKFIGASINLRPAPIFKELSHFCPLRSDIIGNESFEILVIRELSGGIYFGEHSRPTADTALDTSTYDRATIQKIAQFSFQAAQNRKKTLHSIDKANVLETSRLWREVFEAESKNWPEVKFHNLYVDNAVQQLVKWPRQFDVIACPNLFGDIISDLTSVFPGSLGMLGSASFGNKIHLYEPSGGSAPDIQGLNVANPIAQIYSAALMLRHSFEMHEAANDIDSAVLKTIQLGFRTGDIYMENKGETKLSCSDMGDKICAFI
ncbi:3-isopropylmalate dehydrogenase [bacterium]|nr:3-isopropylmalate dehydrogenase [bacterium]NCQ55485.1 3-isopropylmalate dehydrogenase [Candidatus Parcubacteria bacterium]NCS67495.1 3-isopropylmalate dehydrogenase [Candidatus Peregrinibacteria bacterium]NCS96339.1 3-isopropylmalate dehydrogenase [bacterium]